MDDEIRAITADELSTVVRPFLWLATLAFWTGFGGYLALTRLIAA